MSVDYIVASLPALAFDAPAPMTEAAFRETVGRDLEAALPARWKDLDAQMRNAVAAMRGGDRFLRPADGCDLYWRNRVMTAFSEKDPLRRQTILDRVWWDAAGELTPASAPLSEGALFTYYLRLKIVLRRTAISAEAGNALFDRLTAATKLTF